MESGNKYFSFNDIKKKLLICEFSFKNYENIHHKTLDFYNCVVYVQEIPLHQ